MKSKQTRKNKKVLIYIFAFLFIVGFAFLYYNLPNSLKPITNQANQEDILSSQEMDKQLFAKNNKEQIDQLKMDQQKLAENIIELGIPRREFNEQLQNIITLLQKYDEDSLWENWQEFQKEFEYEYKKMNTEIQSQTDLPKNTLEAEGKIMQILQELNQIIQSMHK